MSIKRKQFLRLSVWGFIATLLPLEQIKALSFISELTDFRKEDHKTAMGLAEEAKEAFYQKQYAEAESLYLQCIQLAPADIRFYDNLQNVYGAQSKHLLTIQLFNNALQANPNSVVFYDRAARSLMRLELGYKNIAEQYRIQTNSASLLGDAEQLYYDALLIDPNANFLTIGLNKVSQKIKSNAINIDYRNNETVIQERIIRRREHKARFNNYTNTQLLALLPAIDSKTRCTLYFPNEIATRQKNIIKEKKFIYSLLANRSEKNEDYQEAINYGLEIYNLDNEDTNVVNLITRLYKYTDNYSDLLTFRLQINNNNETVYTHLGVMEALTLRYIHDIQNIAFLEDAILRGENLIENWSLMDSLLIKVTDKLAQVYALKNDFNSAKDLLQQTIEDTGTYSEGFINILLYRFSKCLLLNGELENARQILLFGLGQRDENFPKYFEFIENLALRKTDNSFSCNTRLYYLLYEVYINMDEPTKANSILQAILQNDPQDRFALKRF